MNASENMHVLGILAVIARNMRARSEPPHACMPKRDADQMESVHDAVCELILAASEIESDAEILGMTTTRLTAALKRVGADYD